MLSEITGNSLISGPGELKLSVLQGPARQLPAQNSIVGLTVLDKTASGIKLLIEGNVFSANLPVAVSKGDCLLAKVMSSNPFVLSLDGLFQMTSFPESLIGALASKLGLESSRTINKVIRALISGNKPVSKAKAEQLSALIEKQGNNIDESQLMFLLGLSQGGTELFQQFGESAFEIFAGHGGAAAGDIYNGIISLNDGYPDCRLTALLNKAFVIDFDETPASPPDISRSTQEILEILEETARSAGEDPELRQQIPLLGKSLSAYLMQKAWYAKSGMTTDFVIVKDNGRFSLVRYEVKKMKGDELNPGFRIHLDFLPDNTGPVMADIFYTKRNMQISFNSNPETSRLLEKDSPQLQRSVGKFLHLMPALFFKTPDGEPGFVRSGNTGGINVRL